MEFIPPCLKRQLFSLNVESLFALRRDKKERKNERTDELYLCDSLAGLSGLNTDVGFLTPFIYTGNFPHTAGATAQSQWQ